MFAGVCVLALVPDLGGNRRGHQRPRRHSCYVHLYINGLYWGVYDPCDRPDASFAASYFGGQKEDYDAFNGSEPSPPVDGDAAARKQPI